MAASRALESRTIGGQHSLIDAVSGMTTGTLDLDHRHASPPPFQSNIFLGKHFGLAHALARALQMRIALLTRRFDPHGGGTERDLIITADCLRAAGHEVTIFAREFRGADPPTSRCRRSAACALGRTAGLLSFAYRAPAAARARWRRPGAELRAHRRRRCDALGWQRARQLPSRGAPMAQRGRSGGRCARRRTIARRCSSSGADLAAPQLKAAIAVSNLVRDDLMREFHLPARKVVTLYNGVDLDRFTPPRDDSARREIRSTLQHYRWRAHWSHSSAMASAARACDFSSRHGQRSRVARICSWWAPIRKADWYQREAVRLGVGARVHFAGAMPDVTRIFHGVDAVALPSLFEPFGNVRHGSDGERLAGPDRARNRGASELLPESMRRFVVRDPTNPDEIAQKMNALLRGGRRTARPRARNRRALHLANVMRRICSRLFPPSRAGRAGA